MYYRPDATNELHTLLDVGTVLEKKMRALEFYDTMQAAATGSLRWLDWNFDSVASFEHLLELRWGMSPFQSETPPVEIRLYFTEPAAEPNVLLALVFHRKDVTEKREIKKLQNEQMGIAETRRVTWLNRLPSERW